MAFVGQDWTQWITRWHNKAADGAANLAMDRKSSFHWQGAEPKQPGDCVLAYADGGCRAQAGLGPGSAACVLVAYQPGQRAARLLQVSAVYFTATTAPLAEAYAANMAATAVETVACKGRPCPLSFPTSQVGFQTSDILSILCQMRQEYFHAGIRVVGTFC